MMEITKIFTFDAAHYLTKYHGKCEKLHGHTYKLEVTVQGDVQESGMVLDFMILKKIITDRVLKKLDHSNLNDIIDNPSSENLVVWIWQQISPLAKHLQSIFQNKNINQEIKDLIQGDFKIDPINTSNIKLKKIKLWETPTSYVSYQK